MAGRRLRGDFGRDTNALLTSREGPELLLLQSGTGASLGSPVTSTASLGLQQKLTQMAELLGFSSPRTLLSHLFVLCCLRTLKRCPWSRAGDKVKVPTPQMPWVLPWALATESRNTSKATYQWQNSEFMP